VRVTAVAGDDDLHAVAAHRLLNASAVVSMGIATLLRLGDQLPPGEVELLLQGMAVHAAMVDEGLKNLTRGTDGDGAAGVPRSLSSPP